MPRNSQRRNTSNLNKQDHRKNDRNGRKSCSIQNRLGKTSGDCRLCQKNHPLRICQKFRKMSVAQRYEVVRKHHYCENCFALSHKLTKCRSSRRCQQCNQRHHSMLHEYSEAREVPPPAIEAQPSSALQRVLTLLPTAVVRIRNKDEWVNVRVMINPCQPASSVAPWLVNKYGLEVDQIGTHSICIFQIQARTKTGSSFKVKARISQELPCLVPQEDIDPNVVSNYSNLVLADPIFYKKAKVNIILGAEIYQKILQPGLIPGNIGTPVVQNTLLGWILVGSFSV